MSRYIKLEDAEKAAGGVSMFNGTVFVEDVLARLADLPTIEVMKYPQVDGITPTLVTPEFSEDAISREYVKGICDYGWHCYEGRDSYCDNCPAKKWCSEWEGVDDE